LHQAVEAKEGVKIERENQTLATITFQTISACTKKLSGMTGTRETEAANSRRSYNLDVVAIPTNRPTCSQGAPRRRLPHGKEKFEAVVNGILQEDNSYANGLRHYHERGQPCSWAPSPLKNPNDCDLLKKSGIPIRF